jgi:two-component system phosphate regulon response regulator OmpR
MENNQPVILVVDDDNRIRKLLGKYLQENNLLVLTAKDTLEARDMLKEIQFDLIILDVMMPKENGKEFSIYIRKNSSIPILMLTAMGEISDRIAGLESGADDYLVKPFEPRELLLRVNKIIARTKDNFAENLDQVLIGNMNFDLKTSRLIQGSKVINLTYGETKLLNILASNKNIVVSREQLALECGGINERSIDVQIIRLRSKIEIDPKHPIHLQSIRGEGYILYS